MTMFVWTQRKKLLVKSNLLNFFLKENYCNLNIQLFLFVRKFTIEQSHSLNDRNSSVIFKRSLHFIQDEIILFQTTPFFQKKRLNEELSIWQC